MWWLLPASSSALLASRPPLVPCSPPGFELHYAKLRELRAASGGSLLDVGQLTKAAPHLAHQLSHRVDFDVPRTRTAAALKFVRQPTALFIGAALAASARARMILPLPLGMADIAAALATAAFWIIQEWVIHDKLLHSASPWYGSTIHRWHHELPYYHVSMDGLSLAVVWFTTVAFLLLGVGTLTHTVAQCLSSLVTYTLCGGIYEAAHFLAHTRTPLPWPLDIWRRHHAQHHCVSDRYWLAFTLPVVDSLFGTNPRAMDVSREMRTLRNTRIPPME